MTDGKHTATESIAPVGAVPSGDGVLDTGPVPTNPPRSQWREVWGQFIHHKGAVAGGIVFFVILIGVFLGPYLWTIDPGFIDIRVSGDKPVRRLPRPVQHPGVEALLQPSQFR